MTSKKQIETLKKIIEFSSIPETIENIAWLCREEGNRNDDLELELLARKLYKFTEKI